MEEGADRLLTRALVAGFWALACLEAAADASTPDGTLSVPIKAGTEPSSHRLGTLAP